MKKYTFSDFLHNRNETATFEDCLAVISESDDRCEAMYARIDAEKRAAFWSEFDPIDDIAIPEIDSAALAGGSGQAEKTAGTGC